LDGRVTYELMAGFWPIADADPAASVLTAEFALIWRDMPKLVYSRTLDHADWNATVVRDVVPAEIARLKEQTGGALILGGADLATTFRQLDLIDEYRFYVQPVLLGRGRLLFQETVATQRLRLVETVTFDGGVVLLRYVRD
jgi:dihydrofolate reductase